MQELLCNQKNGGFTEGVPWIKVNPNYNEINVEDALSNKDSIFYHYKKLIQYRKNNDIVVYGNYKLILENDKEIYAYIRELKGDRILVISNFYSNTPKFTLPEEIEFDDYELIISNYDNLPGDIREFKLRPYESIALNLK